MSRHPQGALTDDRCKLGVGGLLFATAGILWYIWTRALQISQSDPVVDLLSAAQVVDWSIPVREMAKFDAIRTSQHNQRFTVKPMHRVGVDSSKRLSRDAMAPQASER